MTVTTSTARVVHNGNGTTIEFAVPFRFLENGHVAVFLRDAAGNQVPWTENTQYTLAGADAAAGGTLTVITAPTDHTPAAGETLAIVRAVPITQETDYVENDPFPAETHERALDKLTMVNQEQTERLDRTFTIPETDTLAGNFVLPIDTARANRFLAFDALGNPAVAVGTSANLGPVTPFIDTLLDDADAATARTTIGAQEDVIATRGDLVVGGATAAASRLGIGAAGAVLTSDGSDPAWVMVAPPALSMAAAPPEIANNAVDAANDIDFAAKACRDELDTANMPAGSALTKRIDANWAEGNNQGGFPSGLTLTNGTTYHAFKIGKPDGTVDYGFDSSLTAANLLADAAEYTVYRLLGSVLYETATIAAFVQVGDWFYLVAPNTDFNVNNPGTSEVLRAVRSPVGRKLTAKIVGRIFESGPVAGIVDAYFRSADATTVGPAEVTMNGSGDLSGSGITECITDTSARIRTRITQTGSSVIINGGCIGWMDRRGRDG